MTITIGTKLGPYEVGGRLGEGGMGEVWRALDTRLDRDVAIKVLPTAFLADKDRLARFEREARLLAQVHHPNVASIFGVEEFDGVRTLVMELVEGPTLAERMSAGPLSLEESLSIARQIAEALEEAHAKGIVHRDLKPQNIKAPVDGTVKVLDFGLAKGMSPPGSDISPLRELVWLDRAGRATAAVAEPRRYLSVSLSPDDRQAAVTIQGESRDLWITSLERQAFSRLTASESTEFDPIWSHDGKELFYVFDRPPFELQRIPVAQPMPGGRSGASG